MMSAGQRPHKDVTHIRKGWTQVKIASREMFDTCLVQGMGILIRCDSRRRLIATVLVDQVETMQR